MYATVTQVRREAGFTGNTNIADSVIEEKIRLAEGMINGYLGNIYTLPIPKYYRNTITFSGTGTGAGTLTITIDGRAYAITIALGTTASQAADLFRTAADIALNTSFITDGLGSGVTVTLNSEVAGDSTDVTISANTSPQAGITATGGTVTEVTVPFVERLGVQVAAALLLIEEYGPEAEDSDKDGQKKLDFIIDNVLDKILDKTLKIYNFVGVELPTSSLLTPSYLPNATTSDEDAEDSTYARFTMNRTF